MNKQLMRDVMDYIDAHPEEHNQRTYASLAPCGTTFCYAGTTLVMQGYKPLFGIDSELKGWVRPNGESTDEEQYGEDSFELARKELGLTEREAGAIFLYLGDAAGVREMVHRTISGEFRGAHPTKEEALQELVEQELGDGAELYDLDAIFDQAYTFDEDSDGYVMLLSDEEFWQIVESCHKDVFP